MDQSSTSSKLPADHSRRNFIKIGAALAVGAVVAGAAEYVYSNGVVNGKDSTIGTLQSQNASLTTQYSVAESQVSTLTSQNSSLTSQLSTARNQASSLQTQLASADTQISALQGQVSSLSGSTDALVTLGVQEAAVITAAANVIIPADSNGPGAVSAGVIYFIDRQLAGDYGNNGRMYNKGPFIPPNVTTALTVNSTAGIPITYNAGTPPATWTGGQTYAYAMSLRNFWHTGVAALETYANGAYGGNFESLSAEDQLSCLQDLFNNKPATFNYILPTDFANELFFMVWSGFTTDPMYGGNRGMVGWKLTASPGLNSGNFYGEGETAIQRAVASAPTILGPVSTAQFQQSLKISGVLNP